MYPSPSRIYLLQSGSPSTLETESSVPREWSFSFCAPAQAVRSPLLDISAQHREATMRLLHHPAAQPAGKQHSRHAVNPCIFHTYAQTSIQALCLHTLAKRTKVKPFIFHTYKIDRGYPGSRHFWFCVAGQTLPVSGPEQSVPLPWGFCFLAGMKKIVNSSAVWL